MRHSHNFTWQQLSWFISGCITLAIILSKALILKPKGFFPWLTLLFHAMLGYAAADLATGIYHWAIDNYGGPDTPIFGPQIEDFVNHHHQPSLSADQPIVKSTYRVAAAVTVAGLLIAAVCGDPEALAFAAALSGFGMFSLRFHTWSHRPPHRLPRVVLALQDAGVLLRRTEHMAHHRPPFNSRYCIVSGIWNRLLDKTRFFRAVEVLIFTATGVRPWSWTEQDSGVKGFAE